jgi:hypothetical protein
VAVFISVAGIGLVAIAALAWSTMLRIDDRRSDRAETQAQLRQLMLYGLEQMYGLSFSERDRLRWVDTMPLPAALRERGASWVIEGDVGRPETLELIVRLDGEVMREPLP